MASVSGTFVLYGACPSETCGVPVAEASGRIRTGAWMIRPRSHAPCLAEGIADKLSVHRRQGRGYRGA